MRNRSQPEAVTVQLFRIHLADGSKLDIDASSPDAARERVKELTDQLITKIKRI